MPTAPGFIAIVTGFIVVVAVGLILIAITTTVEKKHRSQQH